ncbi:MAG: hypothetical protein M3Y65_05990 [Pseudomonadota bacterium]|nr:hypothetical protein [Pseudomonadota bacterium]
MSNSLHNKIYLGRHSLLGARRLQRVLLVGAIVGVAGVWLALASWR